MRASDAVRLLRPKQWTKNLLVFAALLFTRSYLEPELLGRSVLAFVAMSLLSSATYVLNDRLDVERDRRHPTKRNRPLASGAVPLAAGQALMALCLVGALFLGAWLGRATLAILLGYLVLQALYNAFLKRQAVADVFTLATGFILRAVLGAVVIDVKVSPWLLFCTGALALLLGFAKRRSEFVLQGQERESSRENLGEYTRTGLDALVVVSAAGAAMSYGIYAIDSHTAAENPALIVTCAFVYYGIFRYLFLVFGRDEGGEPETLLFRDPHLVASLVLFTLSALAAMGGWQIPFIEAAR